MAARPRSTSPPVAVIDIGSNSGRVVVLTRDGAGQLRFLTGSRAPLRLVHDVDDLHSLSEESMARTMEALRDFRAIALGAGARPIVAFATAAMRDAANGALFLSRVRRELGLRVELIDGTEEARYGFAGAARGLPVTDGLLFDLGGGSMQVSRFKKRRLLSSVSLPLGALRLNERFLASDPPKAREVRRLRGYVRKQLKKAGIGRLGQGDMFVGTGGTLRNLAKIDRSAHPHAIRRLHGYLLSRDGLRDAVRQLVGRRQRDRSEIPGLSAERADSIVGGALAIETLMEVVRAREILVSGQGVREGIAQRLLRMTMTSTEAVKDAALSSLTARFGSWDADAADRRRFVAAALVRAIDPGLDRGWVDALDHGARVLDIGRALDFFDRHEHVADMLLATDLDGFRHEEIAWTSALIRIAGNRHADPVDSGADLSSSGRAALDRAAVLLVLADEIERRCPQGRPIALSCQTGRDVRIAVRQLHAWRSKDLTRRFERTFGKPLVIRAG
jgi:exopolyphosphatase/guanosine-5'-triphosphate,3'-diphosphate pyrophosphatase